MAATTAPCGTSRGRATSERAAPRPRAAVGGGIGGDGPTVTHVFFRRVAVAPSSPDAAWQRRRRRPLLAVGEW